jgi:hypothetical protein
MLASAWSAMDRRTAAYEPALTIIQLLLGDEGPTLNEDGDDVRLKGFLFDMNRFFQALHLTKAAPKVRRARLIGGRACPPQPAGRRAATRVALSPASF